MKIRIIGIINILNGITVQSINFKKFLPIGNPKIAIDYLCRWGIDEIIILNIDRSKKNFKLFKNLIKGCFIPVGVGGGIRNLSDVDYLIRNGADKVLLNTFLLHKKNLAKSISLKYGSQSLIASIDIKKKNNKFLVFTNAGKKFCDISLEDTIKAAEQNGVGEILLNSIDYDGSKKGFDESLLTFAHKYTNLPLNICGGAGSVEHIKKIIKQKPSAVCAANFFHFKEQRVRTLKNFLYKSKYKKNIRLVN